jgi:hypothetical protein
MRVQDSHEVLEFEEAPERRGVNSAGEAAEMLRQAASDAGSAELLAISELIEKTRLPGEEGLEALAEAADRLAEVNTGQLAETARPNVEQVMAYIIWERSTKEMESQLLRDARDVTNQTAQMGDNQAMRERDARDALDRIIRSDYVQDTAATERGSEPLTVAGTHDPIEAARQNFRNPNGLDPSTFEVGFQNETRLAMSRQLIDLAGQRMRDLGEGEKIPDTVINVIGNRPGVVQEILGFTTGSVIDQGRALRMPFTELADAVGVKLPDEILSRLDKSGPTTPPPPG